MKIRLIRLTKGNFRRIIRITSDNSQTKSPKIRKAAEVCTTSEILGTVVSRSARSVKTAICIFSTAAYRFVKNDIRYTVELRKKYSEIRNPYAKAVACTVFSLHGMLDEADFLLGEYNQMKLQYPDENFADFPLLALHILHDDYGLLN